MSLLDPEQRAFLLSGVSISLASSLPGQPGCIARALGCRLIDDGARIAVFLRRRRAQALLEQARQSDRIANVFCLPSSNRTLQLKGREIRIEDFPAADLPAIEAHLQALLREVMPLGVPEAVARTIFAYRPDDLVLLSYAPKALFSQTPGPRAGVALGQLP